MRLALRFALLFAVAAAVVIGSCYAHGPNPPPCTNVETCGNPADPPPVWDRTRRCLRIGVRVTDAGAQDDAGVWRYPAESVVEPCTDGGTR